MISHSDRLCRSVRKRAQPSDFHDDGKDHGIALDLFKDVAVQIVLKTVLEVLPLAAVQTAVAEDDAAGQIAAAFDDVFVFGRRGRGCNAVVSLRADFERNTVKRNVFFIKEPASAKTHIVCGRRKTPVIAGAEIDHRVIFRFGRDITGTVKRQFGFRAKIHAANGKFRFGAVAGINCQRKRIDAVLPDFYGNGVFAPVCGDVIVADKREDVAVFITGGDKGLPPDRGAKPAQTAVFQNEKLFGTQLCRRRKSECGTIGGFFVRLKYGRWPM